MFTRRWVPLSVLALAALACTGPDEVGPTLPAVAPLAAPIAAPAAGSALAADRGRHERLAERIARALRDEDFRRTVVRALDASPDREHKVHLQAFLAGNAGRERARLERLSGTTAALLEADLDQSAPIEMYLPVPDHRRRWRGDGNLIVATAETDADAPVGFDRLGRRILLDPRTPPATPVLMVSRAEQSFGPAAQTAGCILACTGGGGGSLPPGLYLTRTQFTQTFESWFKGQPEFEVHVLGQDGSTSKLTSYQCAGEHAGGLYTFDQNGTTWAGNVLLFSGAQFQQYNQLHPNQNVRVFVVEDDDTACQIKVDSTRATKLFNQLKVAYAGFSGGKDSTTLGSVLRIFTRATVLLDLFKAAASFIKTNDEIVGNAVADSLAAASFFPAANWVVKGENSVATGGLRLEMR